jgi:hypothetical protein
MLAYHKEQELEHKKYPLLQAVLGFIGSRNEANEEDYLYVKELHIPTAGNG